MNVLITGANRGIGFAFTKHYLDQGCHVWACYRTERAELDQRKHEHLHHLQWDVTQAKTNQQLHDTKLPAEINLLINNAGVYGPHKDSAQSLESVTAHTMHEVFDIDCVGAIRVVQTLLPRIITAKGVIANISSKMGSTGDNSSGGCYAYRAAKAALVIVSRSMAIDLAPHGVRVISLHPGWVRTRMVDFNGLIDTDQSAASMATVIEDIDQYEPGSFVAYDGTRVAF